jgi:hypothetical protein
MTTAAPAVPTIELTDEDRPDCGCCGGRSSELIEVAPNSNHFVPRCPRCFEIPAEPDEDRLSKNGKPAFNLTLEQKNAIFAGDHTAIKLKPDEPKPEVEAGQVVILAMSRGGKQFLAKTEKERRELVERGEELLTEIPSEPTVWIELHEPKLKEGRWQVSFDAKDTRESTRTLASAPTGSRQPGLKTRLRKRVPTKDEDKEPKLTDDAARGYGGGGKSTVDEREGVDDGTLARYSRVAEEDALKKRMKHRQAAKGMEREMRAAELRKRKLATGINPARKPLTVADTAAPLKPSADTV